MVQGRCACRYPSPADAIPGRPPPLPAENTLRLEPEGPTDYASASRRRRPDGPLTEPGEAPRGLSLVDAESTQRAWHRRTGEYSPDYYAHYGPDSTSERVRVHLDATVGTDGTVLELGCSAGRHLAHLYSHGYRDLWGVDVNADAGTVMRQAYPKLADEGTFVFEAIQDVIADFDDGQFDAVYTVETLQHLHPDHDWVLAELARVTGVALVTVEAEADGDPGVTYVNDEFPLYRRDWGQVFTALGLEEIECEDLERVTLRVFR